MNRSLDEAETRIAELERLVSKLRHDLNGAVTPVLLVADGLRSSEDPRVQRGAEKIVLAITQVTKLLRATRDTVPSLRATT